MRSINCVIVLPRYNGRRNVRASCICRPAEQIPSLPSRHFEAMIVDAYVFRVI